MKFFQKLSIAHLFVLAFFVCLTSCSDNDNLSDNDGAVFSLEVQDLKASVQSSNSFAALQKSNTVFFNQLKNHEIDLFEAHSFINNLTTEFNCDNIDGYDSRIKGFEDYATAKCQQITYLGEIHNFFPQLKELSSEELSFVFKVKESISSRAFDCLDQFQSDWQAADDVGYDSVLGSSTQHALQEYAVYNYDRCCENGGDGCP